MATVLRITQRDRNEVIILATTARRPFASAHDLMFSRITPLPNDRLGSDCAFHMTVASRPGGTYRIRSVRRREEEDVSSRLSGPLRAHNVRGHDGPRRKALRAGCHRHGNSPRPNHALQRTDFRLRNLRPG